MSTAAESPASEEAPKSIFEKAGAALPVALTMLATTFAGMSTSELQQAMFWRSFAAQDQAKATSQWSLAGFKRDRALICETTAVQLRVSSGYTSGSVETRRGALEKNREALKKQIEETIEARNKILKEKGVSTNLKINEQQIELITSRIKAESADLDKLKKELLELEPRLTQEREKLKTVDAKLKAETQNKIDNLNTEKSLLEERITSYENKLKELHDRVAKLNDGIIKLIALPDVTHMKAQLAKIEQELAALIRDTSINENDIPEEKLALEWLSGKGPPRVELPEVADPILKTLLTEIRERKPEAQILATAAKVTQLNVNKTIDEAEERVDAIDKEWDPTVKAAKKLVEGMVKLADPKKSPAAQAASYDLENRRYRAESVLNQGIGYLYEARVKVSTAESDKHRRKSTNIFYAMLAAQIGATISSLALARRQKSLLWLFAGLAGIVSIGIAAYITLATA